MDHPTILLETVKQHQGEIMKEMASWRMANQATTASPGLIKRFVTASEALLKKLVLRQKQERHSPDEDLILNTN